MSQPKQILIIDDELDLRENIQFLFEAKGYAVEQAENGLDGIRKLQNCRPDLIVLDINMPEMNGIEFVTNISDKNGKPMFPILMLTARANMQQMFKDLNIDGFIPKPFDHKEVLKEAELIIENHGKDKNIKHSMKDVEKSVFIVDNDRDAFNSIAVDFLSAGFKVDSAFNATDAIAKISENPPAVALVKLGLDDISGDVLIGKLNYITKTSNIKCILYSQRTGDEQVIILNNYKGKEGICDVVAYSKPSELMQAVETLFIKGEAE